MKINEFSKRAIRRYEERGLLKSQRNTGNKYRIYSSSQISLGQKINQFRNLGFSVKDIASLLKSSPTLEVKDEELQMLAGAYAHLFLMAAARGTMKEFSSSHRLVAKCLKRSGEDRLAIRHMRLAQAYSRI